MLLYKHGLRFQLEKHDRPTQVITETLWRAIEQNPSTVIVTSLDSTILYVNPRFTELSGYSSHESIGKKVGMLSSGKTPPHVYEDLWYTLRAGNSWRGELLNKKKDGTFYWSDLTISPVKNEKGEPTHYVAQEEDITERKNAELELKQAIEELRNANIKMKQFTAMVSHDLQGPLSVVKQALELLVETSFAKLSEEEIKLVKIIERKSSHMHELIRDLLEYARAEGAEFEEEKISMVKVVERSLDNLRATIEKTEANITVGPLPTVKGSFSLLNQLVQNLISNAIKYCSGRTPVVQICVEPREHEWLFSVTDNGIGIDEKNLDLIFAPFKRLHSESQFPGTGIGLATVKKIVELHKGTLWVTSTVGVGSTFYFTLPKIE